MRRWRCFAVILLLALASLGASVWEGSAIVGGAGDFPGDGLFGACNSFPRDASVEVRNLENGKTVTVVITKNVDNPGVFIALSPKAASELGMRQGAAARVRARTLSLSMTDASLPATRAGETSDPDFNPKVFVERDKAAAKAAAATEPQAEPAAALIAEATAPTPAAAAEIKPAEVVGLAPPKPSAGERPAVAPRDEPSLPAAASEPEAESPAATEPATAGPALAEITTPETPSPAVSSPATTLPEAAAPVAALPPEAGPTAAPTPEAAPSAPAAAAPEKFAADSLPASEGAAANPGEPRPEALAMSLPIPDAAPLPAAAGQPAARSFPANVPEAIGGSYPRPRPAPPLKAYLPEPGTAIAAAELAPGSEEAASLEALERPEPVAGATEASLSEPEIVFTPEELPEELLPRLSGPAPEVPDVALAEIDFPLVAEAGEGPDAIDLERPLAESATVEAPLDEPAARELVAEAGPEAIGEGEPEAALVADADLLAPEAPLPLESLSSEKPEALGPGEASVALDEPQAVAASSGTVEGPTAISAESPPREGEAEVELPNPEAPSPTEQIVAAAPAREGAAEAELPGPEAPSPSEELVAAAPAGEGTAEIEVPGPESPYPSEELAAERPAVEPAEGGEIVISLEPTVARPPVAKVEEPAAGPAAPTKPTPAEPEAPKPQPVAAAEHPEPAALPATVPASVPLLEGLAKGSYYVQIGVYGSNESLSGAVDGFRSTYPLAVEQIAAKGGARAYRLYIGPLTRDESGLVLFRIKSMGYRDAFLKQGS